MYQKTATEIRIAQLEIKLARLEKLAKEAGLLTDIGDWWSGVKLENHPMMHTILNYLKQALPNFEWKMNRTTADEYGSFNGWSDDFHIIFSFNIKDSDSIYVDTFYIIPQNKSIDPYYSELRMSDKEVGFTSKGHADAKLGLEIAKYVEKIVTKYTITNRRVVKYYN